MACDRNAHCRWPMGTISLTLTGFRLESAFTCDSLAHLIIQAPKGVESSWLK